MPTSTFFNLQEEKRNRVVEAAMEEFAANPFHQASVTRIIDRAGIASGSFYQYFSNKKDLYKYIIKRIGDKKMEYLAPLLKKLEKPAGVDFFELLRDLYLGGIRFARENPHLSAIGSKLFTNKDGLYDEIMGDQLSRSVDFFENLIRQGIERGAVDPEIDPRLLARVLTKLNLEIGEIVYEDGRLDLDDMAAIDKVLYFIKNGLGSKQS